MSQIDALIYMKVYLCQRISFALKVHLTCFWGCSEHNPSADKARLASPRNGRVEATAHCRRNLG